METYNGWPGSVRQKRLNELRVAERLGTLPPRLAKGPGPCEICTQTENTMWHAEQYGPTWEAYLASFHALCGHCHAMLHLRFRFPNRWKLHLIRHADGAGFRADPPLPARYVASVGVIFRECGRWKDANPDLVTCYRVTDSWWHHLPVRRAA